MENPYKVRAEENLFYVLSQDSHTDIVSTEIQKVTLIIMNLYYLDTIERYLRYLDSVPQEVQICIVSSVDKVLEQVSAYVDWQRIKNVKIVKKENRGRDISALLVACRQEILNYKYLCFVHDKKANWEGAKEDTDLWIENLWDNMLCSQNYIYNIINILEKHHKIGLLVPHEPIGEYYSNWFSGTWGNNFQNTRNLANRLNIKYSMSPEIPVITLGTCFWCKTDALRKLFLVEWKYEDFDREPLPIDGTVSHAIERIFSFVAKDAGYETGTVMCESYAGKLLTILQEDMREMYDILNHITCFQGKNMKQLNILNQRMNKLKRFCDDHDEIYLYGAGKVGNECLSILKILGYQPMGFIVTEQKENREMNGIRVIGLNTLKNTESCGVIITVGRKLYAEIVSNLDERGFEDYISYINDMEE